MALNLALKNATTTSPVPTLYRSMLRELPKVLSIYDIDMPLLEAQQKIKTHFTINGAVKDERVKEILIAKGYMELEETLMQWKQKAQLMRVFEGQEGKFGADVKVADRAVDVKAEWERLQKDKKEGIKVL
ncbi:hypothetical protein TrLO_g6667 [Triparma laevis f. longispina]|uniref:Complex 1 LYR protein domain-containing protein n=1 Tax=Triparma laevis f. longispina TaxID=1714387 RepID=A0A9W7E594_9STRA|nr:hypothetical protein TrLO_g6667 [Triparma laevis f. longispina]